MHRFYWVIDNVLAGCSRPGGGRDGDIDRDLATLRGYGIGALLTLTETALPSGALERHGILGLHLPVDDFHAPTTAQMLEALAFLDDARATSTAGRRPLPGRTGSHRDGAGRLPDPRWALRGAGDRRGARHLPRRDRGVATDRRPRRLGSGAALVRLKSRVEKSRSTRVATLLQRHGVKSGKGKRFAWRGSSRTEFDANP